jgi:hypothetical protein
MAALSIWNFRAITHGGGKADAIVPVKLSD